MTTPFRRRAEAPATTDAGPGIGPGGDFFEDIVVGTRLDLGSHAFTRDEIVHFACHYDPQPFHLDEEPATGTALRRLSASGWHTAATWMRLNAQHRDATRKALPARGERPAPEPQP